MKRTLEQQQQQLNGAAGKVCDFLKIRNLPFLSAAANK